MTLVFPFKFSAWRIPSFTISTHNPTMAFTEPTMLPLIFAAFIICFCSFSSLAELQSFQQPLKSDGSLSFLVIGDWGRRGLYNQSEVALQDVDAALSSSTAKWKLVVGHHAILSAGHHGITVELLQQLVPIINGHDHCIQHISSSHRYNLFLSAEALPLSRGWTVV